jgi:hypothetical protein
MRIKAMLKRTAKSLFLLITCLSWAPVQMLAEAATDQGMMLTKGQKNVFIITAENPSPTAAYAAEELSVALKKTLDIDAAIFPESQTPGTSSFQFLVGPLQRAPLPEGFKYEAFIMKNLDATTLQLAGGDDLRDPLAIRFLARTGTLFAVYRFMREHLGIQMLWPGETGIVYPARDSLNLPVLDFTDAPKLPIRQAYYGHGNRYSKDSVRAAVRWGRFNGMGCSKLGLFTHASAAAIGTELFASHPEYYALVNGQRQKPTARTARWKLCHSNPDLPGLFADWGMKHKDYQDYFPVCANDGYGWCECLECRKLDAGQVSRFTNLGEELCVSGRMFTLANRTAAELRRRNSAKEVAIYAYSFYIDPPVSIPRLDDKVLLAICKGISWNLVPADAAKFDELMQLWSKKTATMLLRDYPGNGRGMVPFPYPKLVDHTIKKLYRQFENFQGMSCCGDDSRSYALWGATQFVWARLSWNPEEPLEGLLDEYYRSGWPASHKNIREYFEYFENRAAEVRSVGGNQFPNNLISSLKIMSPEAIAAGRRFLDQAAENALGNADELARIEFLRIALEAAIVDCEYHTALINAGAIVGIKGAAHKGDRKALLKQTMETIERRNAFMEKHRFHQGIPSEPFDKIPASLGWQNSARILYEQSLHQKPSAQISLLEGWRFSIDKPGLMEHFAKRDFDDSQWQGITTGDCWEKQGFGADKYPETNGYNGWGFYRRFITVPKDWTHGRIILCLGAVDESYRVFFDGELIAEFTYSKEEPHAWMTERRFDLTERITNGRHLIAVAVHDSSGNGGIWRPAFLCLERNNLLTEDFLANVVNATRDGDSLVRTAGKSTIRFNGLLQWCSPGTYLVSFRFTPHNVPIDSAGLVRLQVNTKDQGKWQQVSVAATGQNELRTGKSHDLQMTVTIPEGKVGLNAIIQASLERMDVEQLEIVELNP